MENFFSNRDSFKLILKWKYHLAGISFMALVISTFFTSSLFIPSIYQSFGIYYPVNLNSYSEESKSEQMLQILQSQDIKNRLIKDFRLLDHYKIDTTRTTSYLSTLNSKLDKYINFSKTEFESIVIDVCDTDPKTACNMVDSIVQYYNDKIKSLHQQKVQEVLVGKKIMMEKKQKEVDSIEILERSIREQYGILDYGSQTERLTEGYIKLLESKKMNDPATKEIKEMLIKLGEKGGEYLSLNSKLWNTRNNYQNIKWEYEQLLQEYDKDITYVQEVTTPFPADKKYNKGRKLTILISFLASLIIAYIAIILVESKKGKT